MLRKGLVAVAAAAIMVTAFSVPPADARAKKEKQYRENTPYTRNHAFARRPHYGSASDLRVRDVHVRRAWGSDWPLLPLNTRTIRLV